MEINLSIQKDFEFFSFTVSRKNIWAVMLHFCSGCNIWSPKKGIFRISTFSEDLIVLEKITFRFSEF